MFSLQKKTTFQKKIIIVEKELDDIYIDDIGNLKDIPKLAVIDKKCGCVKVVFDREELTTTNIDKK